jgi:hypothetical protein
LNNKAFYYINFSFTYPIGFEERDLFLQKLQLKEISEKEFAKKPFYKKYDKVSSKIWVQEHYVAPKAVFRSLISKAETYGAEIDFVFSISYNNYLSKIRGRDLYEIFASLDMKKSEKNFQIHKNKIRARGMGLIENFSAFEDSLNEGTVEGYRYHFNFEGKKYYITQGKKNQTLFGIKDKESGKWKAMTKGDLFNPSKNDMDRKEMIEFLQRGIKYFNIRNPVEVEDVKESEWAKFFKFELDNKPGRINKKYVILKLQCGKAQAKWHTRD